MNTFKVVGVASTREHLDFYEYETNRQNKQRSRCKAHYELNGKEFRKILDEMQKNS